MKKTILLSLMALSQVCASANTVEGNNFNEKMDNAELFVIQNLATEKLRVYEACKEAECPNGHRMILESDIVVGKRKKKSWLGNYYIRTWKKFYQDGAGHYPAVYRPWYTPIPNKPNRRWWFSQDALKGAGEQASARGAFGWYTALMSPSNHDYQWMHGTYGVAADGDKYIKDAKGKSFVGALVRIVKDTRSSGCTRLSNPMITRLHEILPVGTPIIKIYAQEATRRKKSVSDQYQGVKRGQKWDFKVESEDGVFSQAGDYKLDTFPNATFRTYGSNCDHNSDVYCIGAGNKIKSSRDLKKKADGEFKGVFIVEEGKLLNYSHPKSLTVGGASGIHSSLITTDEAFYQKPRFKRDQQNNND